MKSFAIRAPEELIEGFRTAAAADDRTFSGALRHAMRQTIEARTDEGPAREPAPVRTSSGGDARHGRSYST